MKKKLNIILLMFTISLCSILGIESVWGAPTISDNYSPGSYDQVSSCTGGAYCYSGAVGFRTTLVDATTGKRCNYEYDSKNGILHLCSPTGTKTKSNDYWFDKDNITTWLKKDYCRSFDTKLTKAEHLAEEDYAYSNLTIGSCSDNYTNYGEFEDIFKEYNDITRGNKKYAWKGVSCDENNKCLIEPSRNPNNMEIIRNYFNERQGNGSSIEMARIFIDATGVDIPADTLSKMILSGKVKGLEKINIQFEQLLLVSNYYGEAGYAAVGTVAEATYLYMNDTYSKAGAYTPFNRWCTVKYTTDSKTVYSKHSFKNDINNYMAKYSKIPYQFTKFNNKIYNGVDCDSNMFSGGYWTGWSNEADIGTGNYYLSKSKSPVNVVSKISDYLDKSTNKTLEQLDFSSFYDTNSTANVFSVKIDDGFTKKCHNDAYEYLENNYFNKMDKKGSYYINVSKNNINIGNDWCKVSDTIKENCCNNTDVFDSSSCPQLTNGFLSNVGVIVTETQDDNNNLCAPISCAATIGTIDTNTNKYIDGKLNQLYSYDDPVYENIIKDYLSKNEIATTIFSEGSEQAGLRYELWHDFFQSKAVCNYRPPDCAPDKANVSCGKSNVFTIKDSTDKIEECIKAKFAYNDGSSGSLQSSIDLEYSYTKGDNVYHGYCSEEVSFNFPTGGQTAVAGTVFKWGYNNSNNDIFGTMTVTRNCYIPPEIAQANIPYTFTSNWANVTGEEDFTKGSAGRINPIFNVTYKNAVSSEFKFEDTSATLSVYLHKFESHAYNKSNNEYRDYNYVIYDKNGNAISGAYNDNVVISDEMIHAGDNGYYIVDGRENNPRTVSCTGKSDCEKIDHIKMIATYNIIYNDNFTWYADKSNNGELVSSKDSGVEIDSSYVFAGYGIPMSYITPDNTYCTTTYGVRGSGQSGTGNGNGKLNVSVENVGTKNHGDSGYHFDKLLKNKELFTDDETTIDNPIIDYYCDFKVSNPLFDNEYRLSSSERCNSPGTPKGIDIVFRTVELTSSAEEKEIDEAFPGRSGTGNREIGYNWSKYDNETIAKILKNTVDEQKDPMYEITLDSPTVQMIRSWNNAARDNNIDPYTYMGTIADGTDSESIGYSSYSIVSVNSEGEVYKESEDAEMYKLVKSDFLSALSVELDDDHFSSICVDGDSHVFNCNQSWWLDEAKKKNTITITEKSIEEE